MPEMNIRHHFPNLEEIKTHLQENKKIYIAGGMCLIAGAVGGSFYTRQTMVPSNTISLFVFNLAEKTSRITE